MSVDNSSIRAKLAIRSLVLAWVGRGHVLEAFCGHGAMSRAWEGCDLTRVDKKRDSVADYVGDNERIVPRLIATNQFRIFDLDAYGNPWRLWRSIIGAIVPGVYGFAVTCGIARGLFNGTGSPWVASLCGIPTKVPVNLLPHYDDIVRIILDVPGVTVTRAARSRPRKHGVTVCYWALQVTKD